MAVCFHLKCHNYFLLSQQQLRATRAASRAALRGGQQSPPDASTSLHEEQNTRLCPLGAPELLTITPENVSQLNHFCPPAMGRDEGSGTESPKNSLSLLLYTSLFSGCLPRPNHGADPCVHHPAFREGLSLCSPISYPHLVFQDVIMILNHLGTLSQPCNPGHKRAFWEQLQPGSKVSASSQRAQLHNRAGNTMITSLRDSTGPEPHHKPGHPSFCPRQMPLRS